ncbi:MAG TPA: multicopper oxidase domain-containing protein, partial [Thermomicrobiales bacterium]|nr:multicopper oxidase domain-containing protein [Thermomicrobiales bacterium]
YGPLIVEPRLPAQPYDREYTLMLSEWDLELTPEVAAGLAPRGPRDAQLRGGELGTDLFLINGRMHGAIPPVRLSEGERVLLRVMHAGHLPHPLHIHGHSFRIVATDGHPVPEVAQLTKDTVLVGPAERYDLELVGDNPGVWMVHCHIEHHMANGMMTTLWYDGHHPTGPAADLFTADGVNEASGGHTGHGEASTTEEEPASSAPIATASASSAEAGMVEVELVDDRIQPREIEVSAGTTVTWINKGRDWHSVASNDAGFESGKIEPGASYAFRFETPGVYGYFCRHHALAGMTGQVTVT